MTTAVAKKPSREIKDITANVRVHLDAVQRAREIYQAQMKRAESDYFDRIKRATESLTGEAPVTPEPAPATTEPAQAPPPADGQA